MPDRTDPVRVDPVRLLTIGTREAFQGDLHWCERVPSKVCP